MLPAQLLVELWAPVPGCAACLILGEGEIWHSRGQKMKAVVCSPRVCAGGCACKELIWACRWVILLILAPSTVSRARCSGGTLLPAALEEQGAAAAPSCPGAQHFTAASPAAVPAVLTQLEERRCCLPSFPGVIAAAAAASEPFSLLPLQSPEGLQLHVRFPGQITQP